jgi:hypothetical protein
VNNASKCSEDSLEPQGSKKYQDMMEKRGGEKRAKKKKM